MGRYGGRARRRFVNRPPFLLVRDVLTAALLTNATAMAATGRTPAAPNDDRTAIM